MQRHYVITKSLLLALAALAAAAPATAQTVPMESAAAQGRAMGAAYNAGAGLLNTGLGAIGSVIKGAIGGPQQATAADVQFNGAQGAVAVVAAISQPATPQKVAEGSDEHYARMPRASFEAAVEKAIAVLPEERRADVKLKAMADYEARVQRFNANALQTNAALPLALDSVNAALRSP